MTKDDAVPVTAELLPCPFCGDGPQSIPWHGGGPDKLLIGCYNSNCEAGPAVTGETPFEAITAWNLRHRGSTAVVECVIEEAQFLCDRLDELDWSVSYDDFGNSYNGHVDPSHSRLKKFLASLSQTPAIPMVQEGLREAAQAVVDEAARMTMTMRRRKIFDALAAALSATPAPPVDETDRLRESVLRWRDNLVITRDSPVAGDALRGAALDFVIEQITALADRTQEGEVRRG